MALPPLIEPLSKAYWLPKLSAAARAAIAELDDRPSGKKLLAQFQAQPADRALFRWALELQCVPHSPYGNYLWALLVAVKDYDGDAAVACARRLIGLGLGVGSESGSFQSLEHLDPGEPLPKEPEPSVAKLPMGNMVDNFSAAQYDVSYRSVKGRSSTVLQLTYPDKFRLDLDIFVICDTLDPAQVQAITRLSVGPGQRIMPLRLGPSTTPRLHRAKWGVALPTMQADVDNFVNLVSIGLAGVMSNLPIGFLPGGNPAAAEPPGAPGAPVPEPMGEQGIANRGTTQPLTGPASRAVEPPAPVEPVASPSVTRASGPRLQLRPGAPVTSSRAAPLGPGYRGVEGEVLGDIPADQLPTAPKSSTTYGAAIERPVALLIQERFPNTRFRFNTGAGNTGPDVVWVDGEDPGFNIGDIKPDSDSGWAKFSSQVRRIWDGGPKAPKNAPFRAALIVYRDDGTVYIGTVLNVQP